jgi:hypothetical protein
MADEFLSEASEVLQEDADSTEEQDVQEEGIVDADDVEEPEESGEQETTSASEEEDVRAQWERLPEGMRQRISQAFDAERRLRAQQQESEQGQRGQQPPQSLADLNDQQFNGWLSQQTKAVRERYYELMEHDVDAAEDLLDQWRERKIELKHQRNAEIQERQHAAWSKRQQEVVKTIEKVPEFESVRWAGPQIVQRAQQLGIDPGVLANELRLFLEASQQVGGQTAKSRGQKQRRAFTETVDGGAPPRGKNDEIDEWAKKAADGFMKFTLG